MSRIKSSIFWTNVYIKFAGHGILDVKYFRKCSKIGGKKVQRKGELVKDRKRDPNFKSISGFIPAELSLKIKEKMKERGLTQNELLEEACHMWLTGSSQFKLIKRCWGRPKNSNCDRRGKSIAYKS